MATSLLVIGYGNALRGDDGAGPCAARLFGERCAAQPGPDDTQSRALALHQLLPELVDDLAQAARVVFLDAYPANDGNEREVGAAPLRIAPLLPATDAGGLGLIQGEGVRVTVEGQGAEHPGQGLGAVSGALEVAVEVQEGFEPSRVGLILRRAVFVEGPAGSFQAVRERAARVEVD